MTITELQDKARLYLDEYAPFNDSALLATNNIDVKPIQTYITETLDEAANELLMVLPLHLVKSEELNVTDHKINKDGSGVLYLGDNFLRLNTLKMESWYKPVRIAEKEDDLTNGFQYNPYTMGNPYKPVVVLHQDGALGKSLHYFSCPTTDTEHNIEIGLQISRFDRNNIQDDIAELFAINCAIRVLSIYGMSADALQGQLTAMIQSLSK